MLSDIKGWLSIWGSWSAQWKGCLCSGELWRLRLHFDNLKLILS